MNDKEIKAKAFDSAMKKFKETSKHPHKQSRDAARYGVAILEECLYEQGSR